ncbi:hypothetical protein CEH05_18615 [Halobacillus halophilus]|nr:hypothetical protein [Halobacillus halophilus]ASF41064.1 hypothetical protein CEH05_18615 [Halobacillus halophilus]
MKRKEEVRTELDEKAMAEQSVKIVGNIGSSVFSSDLHLFDEMQEFMVVERNDTILEELKQLGFIKVAAIEIH